MKWACCGSASHGWTARRNVNGRDMQRVVLPISFATLDSVM